MVYLLAFLFQQGVPYSSEPTEGDIAGLPDGRQAGPWEWVVLAVIVIAVVIIAIKVKHREDRTL